MNKKSIYGSRSKRSCYYVDANPLEITVRGLGVGCSNRKGEILGFVVGWSFDILKSKENVWRTLELAVLCAEGP